MKGKSFWVLALALMLTLLSASVSLLVRANASEPASGYRRIATITGPGIAPRGTKWAFDISWVDEASQRYYLADASNASAATTKTAFTRYPPAAPHTAGIIIA